MADKKDSRLKQILEERIRGREGQISVGEAFGMVGGAAKSRLKEMIDPRNILFGGKGLTSILGRAVFGKGYKATEDKKIRGLGPSPLDTRPAAVASDAILVSIKKDTSISAKNSVVLPSMARDMNIMRQNISKLVKLQGGSASSKADMFFARSKERENIYEQQFQKSARTGTTPTPAAAPKSDSPSLLMTIVASLGSIIGGALSGLGSMIGGAISGLSSAITGALGALGAAIGLKSLGKVLPNIGRTPSTPVPGKPGTTVPGPAAPGPGNKPSPETKPSQRYGQKGPGDLTINKGGTKPVPTTKWGKFLAFVEKKAPKLFAKIGARLAAAGTLATIPVLGWVAAAITMGFSLWTAWELYELWKEFSGASESDTTPSKEGEASKSSPTSPTNMNQQQSEMANLIYDRFIEAGFTDAQARAAVANAMAESSLNPSAHNKSGEDSVGLFQMNRKGGLGQGYSVEQLKDPETNIALAIAAAKKSKSFMQASNVSEATAAFVKDVERPANQTAAIAKRTNIAMEMSQSKLGSAIGATSVALAEQAKTPGPVVMNTTNNNVVGGGNQKVSSSTNRPPLSSAYNVDFNSLLLRTI